MLHSLLPSKLPLPPPGPLLVPTIFLVSLGGALLPPSKARSLTITPILLYLLSQFRHPTGDAIQDALLPIQGLILVAHWCDFYVLHHAEREYYRLKDVEGKSESNGDGGERKDGKLEGKKTFWQKLGWHFDLATTARGIGWNWKVKHVPATTPKTKWQFIRTEALKAFIFYALFDIIWYSVQGSPFSTPSPTGPPPLTSAPPLQQILWTWVPGLISYYSMNMQFSQFAALTVALGFYEPGDWPPIMGKLKEVNSVRDLWGRFWHQNLRRTLCIPFQLLTRFVPIKKGTLLSKYSQLYLAFAASAFLHYFPDLIQGRGRSEDSLSQLTYFLVQPLAITFEDFMIYLGEKAGIKKSWKTKALGKVWTFAWFSCCLRLMFQYNIVALSQAIMPSLCKTLFELAGRFGQIRSSTGAREL